MKIAPFGKPLRELIESGNRPQNSIYLFIGINAWDRGTISAKMRPTRTLILPPFDNPILYDWPVRQCDILIYDTGGCSVDYIEQLASELFKCQADIIRVIAPDFSYFATYKKDL